MASQPEALEDASKKDASKKDTKQESIQNGVLMMVFTGIFYTKAELDVFVGENIDATGYVEANINAIAAMVESYINVATRTNFSDSYSGLNVDVKGLLSICAASLSAVIFIQYNTAGFTSRLEAEDMMNINLFIHRNTFSLLKDQKAVTFINGA